MSADSGQDRKEESQPENHQQADYKVNETTVDINVKQPAKKNWLSIIPLILVGGILATAVSKVFDSCSPTPPPPNQELIKHLEQERQHTDSVAAINMKLAQQYLFMATARRQTDSLMILALMQNLDLINKMKPQYEKITSSYRHITNDSLRRL